MSDLITAKELAHAWTALRRVEGTAELARDAALKATAAALASEQAAGDLRKVLVRCGAMPPEGGTQ